MGTRILALIVMLVVGIFTIAFPISFLFVATGDKDSAVGIGLTVAAITTAIVAFTGRARTVWSRLCFISGISGLALPLVTIAVSVIVTPPGKSGAALAGAVFGGAVVSVAAAVVGFFIGAIFLAIAFAARGRSA